MRKKFYRWLLLGDFDVRVVRNRCKEWTYGAFATFRTLGLCK